VIAVGVAVAVVVAVLATRSTPSRRASSNGSTPPPGPGQATTVPEPVVAVGAPTPSTVAGTPPSSAVATSSPAAPSLSGAGAVLGPPVAAVRRPAPASGCGDLADPGWTVANCGTAGEAPLPLTWVVETKPVGSVLGHRVTVWRPATAGEYEAVLVAADDQGTGWSDVRAAVAPVSASGGAQLLVGFHAMATRVLELDLVDTPGRVVLHRNEAGGAAVASPGQLDAWAASPRGGDPACCPSAYLHEVIRNTDGVWRLVLATRATGSAPASQV
jgi:hypothetical protein